MALWSTTPTAGKAANGMSEVAGMGTGSLIHHATHHAEMAAVQIAGPARPAA